MTNCDKHLYIRSKKLLWNVTQLNCQRCGSYNNVQAAHCNWGGGKGRGIKSDDNLIAALCAWCHHEIDNGNKLSKIERQEAWLLAHRRTVEKLIEQNTWPVDIPIPDASQLELVVLSK